MKIKNLLLGLGASTLTLLPSALAGEPAGNTRAVNREFARVTVECRLSAGSDEAKCNSFQLPSGQEFTAKRFAMRVARPASVTNQYRAEFTEGGKTWRVDAPMAGPHSRTQQFELRQPVKVEANEKIAVRVNRTLMGAVAPTAELVWLEFDGYITQQ